MMSQHQIPLQLISKGFTQEALKPGGRLFPFEVRRALTIAVNNISSCTPIVYLPGVLFPHIYTNCENDIPYNVVPMSLTGKVDNVNLD